MKGEEIGERIKVKGKKRGVREKNSRQSSVEVFTSLRLSGSWQKIKKKIFLSQIGAGDQVPNKRLRESFCFDI